MSVLNLDLTDVHALILRGDLSDPEATKDRVIAQLNEDTNDNP